MSNHYPHQNRYIPSKLLPTHYYRDHNEFGIPFKRYPLNFDEHEESGYYIDFNQTHLVYAVPCTDITFSKKYNRDDLKNETIDTTAETRETVGTTAARYHNNWHSRHYPHCAHSSHVQGFDVLTITKLMDYEMQLHDVTPERLKTLFENFACPKRDTVVFEHVWMEQHKFLSMYFKVHKKPLLDYCLFRFPEPPVCPGPGPTPGEGPKVLSVVPMTRYINPETCETFVDLLVTFDRDVEPTISDLKSMFSSVNFDGTASVVTSATQNGTNTMLVNVSFKDIPNLSDDPGVTLTVYLDGVQDLNGNQGTGEQQFDVILGGYYDRSLTINWQDTEFDAVQNKTRVYIGFSREVDYWEGETHITRENVPVSFAVNNISYIKEHCAIVKNKTGETPITILASSITPVVQHDDRPCVLFEFNEDITRDPTWTVSFTVGNYLFKYEDSETGDTYLNTIEEQYTLQWSSLEVVISNYGLMSNNQDEVTGLWFIYPCEETDIVSVDLTKIYRSPYTDLSIRVNPISYNLGPYRQRSEQIVQAGREVYLTFEPKISFSDRYSYFINSQAVTDDSGHYNAYWAHAIPDPEPYPDHGPILQGAWAEYDSHAAVPAKIEAIFDQNIEALDTSNINVVYDDGVGFKFIDTLHSLSLQDFEDAIDELIAFPNQYEYLTLPSEQRLVDYFYDCVNPQNPSVLRHPENGNVWRNSTILRSVLPYIHNCDLNALTDVNKECFSASAYASSSLNGADMFGLGTAYPAAYAGIVKFIEDYAADESLTVSDLLDGTHNEIVKGMKFYATLGILPHYESWDAADTDTQFQAHINELYNEPLGGQTYPDYAIIANRSVVDGIADELNISVSDLLTNTANASTLRVNAIEAGRGFVLIKLLTTACSDTYMLSVLTDIADSTQFDAWDQVISYFPYTNWIIPTDIDFSTNNTNLIMKFDNPNVVGRQFYISVPVNAVRNPDSGYTNSAGETWTTMNTPEVLFYYPSGYYNDEDSIIYISLNSNVPIDFTGSVSDITMTDGINTAHPDRVTIDSDYNIISIEFDSATWAVNQTVVVTIDADTFTNHNDSDYSNASYTANIYVEGNPPAPPATAPTVISTLLTHNAEDPYPYQITLSFDQDVVQRGLNATVTDGVHSLTAFDSVSSSGNTVILKWYEPSPDWIASAVGNISIEIPSGLVYDLTGTVPNTLYTDSGLTFADITTSYTVIFDSAGGSAVASQTVRSGNTAYQPTNPTRTNYTFNYWKLNGVQYNFNTPVTGNITLVADWTYVPPTITVTFNSDGGSAVASQTIQAGTTPTRPTNPTKSGYTFNYWKLNGVQYNFDVALSSNTTLVADWTHNPQPVNPSTTVYSNQIIHTYAGTYSQTNTLHMSLNCQTSQSGTTAKYRFTGTIWAVAGPGASSTYYSDGVTVSATIAGVTATAASTGALNSSNSPVAFDTGWLNVPNGVGTSAGTVTAAIKAVDSAHLSGYCNYNANVSVNKPYTQ